MILFQDKVSFVLWGFLSRSIEFLWKNIKQRSTHNRYLAEFSSLVGSVNRGLVYFAGQPESLKN